MGMLRLGLRLQDFDLERVGFSLVILDRDEEQDAHGYLRMTLEDLDRLVTALRAEEAIDLVALDPEDVGPAEISVAAQQAPEPQADVVALPWLSRGSDEAGSGRGAAPAEEAPRRFLRKRRQPG